MVGDVTNFGARDDVKPDVIVITCKTEQTVTEEECFPRCRLLRISAVATLGPAWTVAVVMVIAALTALKRLPSVNDAKLINGSIICCPRLLARDMLASNFHKCFAHAIKNGGGVAEALSSCRGDYFGAVVMEDLIEAGVIDVSNPGVACAV